MTHIEPLTPPELEHRLAEWEIPFEGFDHPPVYTCEEARHHLSGVAVRGTKNLFLCDSRSERFFLVVVPENARVNMKQLAREVSATRLQFGGEAELRETLGIGAGEVSLLALINDRERCVTPIVDETLWTGLPLSCHPLTNTRTLLIAPEALERFLAKIEHRAEVRRVPQMP